MLINFLKIALQCFYLQDILQNFHPVFRYFFLENFPNTGEWFQRKQSYTRSVATGSIIGYIIGLGDRHVANILLDKETAEFIHIDLGMSFEYGLVLPTPEKVPFRLTQDVIDGLGVLGVEGPLKRCMEVTLNVLRKHRDVLVTIIEVLRHDPLHQWTLTPQQVARLQAIDDDDQSHSSQTQKRRLSKDQRKSRAKEDDEEQTQDKCSSVALAEKALLRVKQKLTGVEDGYAKSVPEQVASLIQQATDMNNLCQLYFGWKAYV